jgi:carbohydrate kinase (thermoresistant glucokinase family)
MIYIIIGVSGSGKTTIGKMLAQALDLSHFDADDYHPQSNIDKMSRGVPLNDEDRAPWLNALADEMLAWKKNGAVLSCSALKEKYRQVLGGDTKGYRWILLEGDRNIIQSRLNDRRDHFFNIELLESQIRELEIPDYALRISVNGFPEQILDLIIKRMTNE